MPEPGLARSPAVELVMRMQPPAPPRAGWERDGDRIPRAGQVRANDVAPYGGRITAVAEPHDPGVGEDDVAPAE